jgi:hypothetical protein
MMPNLFGQNPSGRNVVAITESARYAKDLVLSGQLRILQ